MAEKKIRVDDFLKYKEEKKKFSVLTAYNFQIAKILDTAGVPMLLVGDSVGMVEAGYDSTLPVTMGEIIYHTRSVRRGVSSAFVVADMPFMSYQAGLRDALKNAGRLIKKGGAEAVKIEGGLCVAPTVRAMTEIGIPVMGHIGLTPQSVNALGGYKVQGKTKDEASRLLEDARALESAGIFALVLEGVPATLASEVTRELKIPTIGIGAGSGTDGQVLVINDMLGLTPGKLPRFVKKYADLEGIITKATTGFIDEVRDGEFPKKEHSY
ncbi:MAG: 3-methyl-2-oxobutanoate hydroxymethyltransferase [Deltaproteobacteria bacterium]|nr:3-methyl-2-oxobutanoate hydroxymethyltransferase [Deltaproteobacteria bacterium]